MLKLIYNSLNMQLLALGLGTRSAGSPIPPLAEKAVPSSNRRDGEAQECIIRIGLFLRKSLALENKQQQLIARFRLRRR